MLTRWGYFLLCVPCHSQPQLLHACLCKLGYCQPNLHWWLLHRKTNAWELSNTSLLSVFTSLKGFLWLAWLNKTSRPLLSDATSVTLKKEWQRKISIKFINLYWVSPTTPGQVLSDHSSFSKEVGIFAVVCCGWCGFFSQPCIMWCVLGVKNTELYFRKPEVGWPVLACMDLH